MSAMQNGVNLNVSSITPELNSTIASQENKNNTAIKQLDADKLKVEQQTSKTEMPAKVDAKESPQPLTAEQLDKVAQQLQEFVSKMNNGLEFSVDKESGRDVIKVIDKTTGDLVKQFPSEEVLTLVSKLSEMVGGFIDAKV